MLNSLQAIAAFNFILFAVLIWRNRKQLDHSIYVFSFFLLGKGITVFSNILLSARDNNIMFSMGILLNSFLFFYAPFLYLLALSITKGAISIKEYWLHFIPFIIFSVLSIMAAFYFLYDQNSTVLQDIIWWRNLVNQAYYLQVIAYTGASFWLINDAGNQEVRFLKIKQWLNKILALFLLIWLILLGSALTTSPELSYTGTLVGMILLIMLSNITLVMLLTHPDFFYNNLLVKRTHEPNNELLNKAHYDKLCALVLENEMYKKADLKIGDLAEALNLSVRNTSALINKHYEGNFYDFINFYRVEEAKELLRKSDAQVTILAILYDAGFNSKSVFNTVFKKTVGQTPSAYRANHTIVK